MSPRGVSGSVGDRRAGRRRRQGAARDPIELRREGLADPCAVNLTAAVEDLVHERIAVLLRQPPQHHVAASLVVLDEVSHRSGHVADRGSHPLRAGARSMPRPMVARSSRSLEPKCRSTVCTVVPAPAATSSSEKRSLASCSKSRSVESTIRSRSAAVASARATIR